MLDLEIILYTFLIISYHSAYFLTKQMIIPIEWHRKRIGPYALLQIRKRNHITTQHQQSPPPAKMVGSSIAHLITDKILTITDIFLKGKLELYFPTNYLVSKYLGWKWTHLLSCYKGGNFKIMFEFLVPYPIIYNHPATQYENVSPIFFSQ